MSHDTTKTLHDSTSHGAHDTTAPAADPHASPQGSEVFTTLLGSLGDHHELNIFFNHLPVLPVILVDNGLHVYANEHAMEEAGVYSLHTGHPVRVSDGGSPMLDLSVTNFVAYEWIAMAIVTVLLAIARGRYIKQPLEAPKGIQNVIESVVLYVRDEIVRPNVGTIKRTHRLMPFVLGIFFFVLTLNLVGLLPGCHAATGALGVTAALALSTFVLVNYVAIKDAGIKAWLHHLLGGAPWYMFPIMVPIEIISLFTKPFALMIRLFANMTAGHIVLMSLVGLIFFFKHWAVTPVSVSFSVFIYLLELLVAFLQAYIFAMLTSVFVGLALGDHVKDDGHHHADAHAH
jgi:F-type H+-transporting ATPase subunit a